MIEGRDVDGRAHPGRHDLRNHAGLGQAGGKSKRERRLGVFVLEFFEIVAECGTDRSLGANKERGENKMALAEGQMAAHEGRERGAG